MCGIVALSRNLDRSSIPDARAFLRHGTYAIESRGRHATGFGWADEQGWPWYWKSKGPAGRVASWADLPQGITTAIGHTRHGTLGRPEVNENNHPIVGDGFLLVHNGRVDNYRELLSLNPEYERTAEVDSESLVALLAYPDVLGVKHPSEILELVEGVASLAWLDGEDPGALHLARCSTRPLTIGWTKRQDLVVSSTPQTLAETAKRSKVHISDVIEIPEGSYLRVVAGKIVEWTEFTVNHPKVAPPLDLAETGSRSARSDRGGWMGLEDGDALPGLIDADGIDWGSLVPRRGWK